MTLDIRVSSQGHQNRRKVSEFENIAIQTIQNETKKSKSEKNVLEYQLWNNFKLLKVYVLGVLKTGNWNRKKYLKKYWLKFFQIYLEPVTHRSIIPNLRNMKKNYKAHHNCSKSKIKRKSLKVDRVKKYRGRKINLTVDFCWPLLTTLT